MARGITAGLLGLSVLLTQASALPSPQWNAPPSNGWNGSPSSPGNGSPPPPGNGAPSPPGNGAPSPPGNGAPAPPGNGAPPPPGNGGTSPPWNGGLSTSSTSVRSSTSTTAVYTTWGGISTSSSKPVNSPTSTVSSATWGGISTSSSKSANAPTSTVSSTTWGGISTSSSSSVSSPTTTSVPSPSSTSVPVPSSTATKTPAPGSCAAVAASGDTYVEPTTGDVYKVQPSYDYQDSDLAPIQVSAYSGCFSACSTYFPCVAFVYLGSDNGGNCYLKSRAQGGNTNPGACAGARISDGTGLRTYINPTTTSASVPATTPAVTAPSTSATAVVAGSCAALAAKGPYYISSTGQNYTLQCGEDHNGGDLQGVPINSFVDCTTVCDKTVGCIAYSYTNNGGSQTCYLKSAITHGGISPGVDYAYKNQSTPQSWTSSSQPWTSTTSQPWISTTSTVSSWTVLPPPYITTTTSSSGSWVTVTSTRTGSSSWVTVTVTSSTSSSPVSTPTNTSSWASTSTTCKPSLSVSVSGTTVTATITTVLPPPPPPPPSTSSQSAVTTKTILTIPWPTTTSKSEWATSWSKGQPVPTFYPDPPGPGPAGPIGGSGGAPSSPSPPRPGPVGGPGSTPPFPPTSGPGPVGGPGDWNDNSPQSGSWSFGQSGPGNSWAGSGSSGGWSSASAEAYDRSDRTKGVNVKRTIVGPPSELPHTRDQLPEGLAAILWVPKQISALPDSTLGQNSKIAPHQPSEDELKALRDPKYAMDLLVNATVAEASRSFGEQDGPLPTLSEEQEMVLNYIRAAPDDVAQADHDRIQSALKAYRDANPGEVRDVIFDPGEGERNLKEHQQKEDAWPGAVVTPEYVKIIAKALKVPSSRAVTEFDRLADEKATEGEREALEIKYVEARAVHDLWHTDPEDFNRLAGEVFKIKRQRAFRDAEAYDPRSEMLSARGIVYVVREDRHDRQQHHIPLSEPSKKYDNKSGDRFETEEKALKAAAEGLKKWSDERKAKAKGRRVIHHKKPGKQTRDAIAGVHHCPWTDDESCDAAEMWSDRDW